MTPAVVVGELNPYGADPRYALYDEPASSAGGRLRRLVFGLRRVSYFRHTQRLNLCTGAWDDAAARVAAGDVWRSCVGETTVVLLGRKVARSFGLDWAAPFSQHRVGAVEGGLLRADAVLRYVVLPHPSGRCRAWNEVGSFERARGLLREVRPEVPWGESP